MKKTLILLLALASSTAATCIAAPAGEPVPVEAGVSKALATLRASQLKDILYHLHITVPEDKDQKVTGILVLDFNYNRPYSEEDLQIDFCGTLQTGADGKVSVRIGNRNIKAEYLNEHIVIPHKELKNGANRIEIRFQSSDKSLNRRQNFMYTLFVPANARYAFPCFDQPDLKARFELSLNIPKNWKAVSAGKQVQKSWKETTVGQSLKRQPDTGTKDVIFENTGHIPTYLFSFVAGEFEEYTGIRSGVEFKILHRQKDSAKLAQLPQITEQILHSVKWMEDYTGIPFPFSKLDFAVLPGYQFGGMEHIGAIQFTDRRIFLEPNPTQDQLLSRAELIAHEVSHMWFGDLVTMKWFDDVWTKEVFANYMASMIVSEQFPEVNHSLDFIRNYHIPALEEDRTDGSHPIAQSLDNLKDAGLLYGNIIYKKAPIVMKKLNQLMGDGPFRSGLQKYLKAYSYSNATWDNLIDILSLEVPQADLKTFSQNWVKERGCPTVITSMSEGRLTVRQLDFQGTQTYRQLLADITGKQQQERNIVWPQNISYANDDGNAYGRFLLNKAEFEKIDWTACSDQTCLSFLINIYENALMKDTHASDALRDTPAPEALRDTPAPDALMGTISASEAFDLIVTSLYSLKNQLVISSALDFASSLMSIEKIDSAQAKLQEVAETHPIKECRQKALRILIRKATDKDIVEHLYDIWKQQKDTLLNQTDYINLSYQLALRYPEKWKEILDRQLSRISSQDKRTEFEFVSRFCTPDKKQQDELFALLLEPQNRKVEPWTLSALSLLNHPLREPESNRFIRPALDKLLEVQQTGDIFFPKSWCSSLLSGHRSPQARQILLDYLKEQFQLQQQPTTNHTTSSSATAANASSTTTNPTSASATTTYSTSATTSHSTSATANHSTSGSTTCSATPVPQPLLNKLLMSGYFLLNISD